MSLHILEVTTTDGETVSEVIRSSTLVIKGGVLVYLSKDNDMVTLNVGDKLATVSTKPYVPKKRGRPPKPTEPTPPKKMKTVDHNGYGKSTGEEERIYKFAPSQHHKNEG